MDALEIAEFLESRATGVLSLAKDDDGYAVPVSYTYVDDGPYIYLRLGYGPDSRKRAFLETGGAVSFVVYDETDEGWKSVVARGHLDELSKNSLDSIVVESVEHLDIPYFDVHDRPVENLEFTIARITVTDLTGIVEGS
jgi:hypothetical protein